MMQVKPVPDPFLFGHVAIGVAVTVVRSRKLRHRLTNLDNAGDTAQHLTIALIAHDKSVVAIPDAKANRQSLKALEDTLIGGFGTLGARAVALRGIFNQIGTLSFPNLGPGA